MADFDFSRAAIGLAGQAGASPAAGEEYDFARAAAGGREPLPMPPEPKPAATRAERAGQAVGGALSWISDLFTGDSRRELDLPELPPEIAGQILPDRGQVGALLSLGRNDKAKAGIYQQLFPGHPVRFDKFGNAIVTVPNSEESMRASVAQGVAPAGKDYYLNRPGLSGQDFEDLGTTAMLALPFARAGGAGLASAGLIGKAVGTGAGVAAGGVVQDEAARELGAPEGANPTHVVTDFAAGGAGELLGPLVSAGARKVFGAPARSFVDAAGRPTEPALRAFAKAGIDAEAVTADMLERFGEQAAKGANPVEAARYAAAQSLPVPVPTTTGKLTGRGSDQMFEDLSAKGAFGKTAETVMRGQEQRVQDALRGNIATIQGRLSGGKAQIGEAGEGGAMAQARLVAMKKAEREGVDAAYDAARSGKPLAPATEPTPPETTGDAIDRIARRLAGMEDDGAPRGGSGAPRPSATASMPEPEMRVMRSRIGSAVVNHDISALPRTDRLLGELDGLVRSGEEQLPIRQLFEWRARASNARQAGGEEATAIGKMIRQFDSDMTEAVERGLMSGDPQAVKLWRDAISANKEFAGRFKSPDLVGALTAVDPANQFRLKVAPEAAANYIFGKAEMGLAGRPELARELVKVRDLLGAGSAEWSALREEVFMRFARAGEGAMVGGTEQFSGANFKRAWAAANNRNAPLMREMFSAEERSLIGQFADVAAFVTNPAKGGANFSNTTPAAVNVLSRIANASFLGPEGKAWLSIIAAPAYRTVQGMRAIGRTDAVPTVGQIGPGVTGAVAAPAIDDALGLSQ